MMYHPPKKILDRYAHVLVNFALDEGKGIRKGDVVYLVVDEVAKPFYVALRNTILRAGGHVIGSYRPSVDDKHNLERDFFLIAENHQLEFFPATYMKGLVDTIDHSVFILSETDMQALKGIDPKKMMTRGLSHKPYMEWRTEKENRGKFTWTLALYGTRAIAKEAGLSEKEYWKQIIDACFLNENDPVAKWKSVYKKLDIYRKKLDRMPIDRLHVEGPDADLWIKLGEKKKWMGGSGRNIPSFELFTSPDWRGTEGWIKFNQPLYRYGNLITGIRLEFKGGKVVKATAKKNESVLKHMIATANADKVGEFSMTDRRFSHITKFMANTLFDENIGGPQGNSHIALGNAYHDCYQGDPSKVSKKGWERLGFNNSSVHTDIISTAPRMITAHLRNGKQQVIYKNGEYQF